MDTKKFEPIHSNCSANHAVLTDQNVERLKHAVAFQNPQNLSPDQMVNHILDLYFSQGDSAC